MKILNLNRIFTYNKALRHYNKTGSLTHRQLLVLLSVAHLDYAIYTTIFAHLKRFYHSLSPKQLINCLDELQELNLLSSKGIKPCIYSLTPDGENVLTSINDRCAFTRIDK